MWGDGEFAVPADLVRVWERLKSPLTTKRLNANATPWTQHDDLAGSHIDFHEDPVGDLAFDAAHLELVRRDDAI